MSEKRDFLKPVSVLAVALLTTVAGQGSASLVKPITLGDRKTISETALLLTLKASAGAPIPMQHQSHSSHASHHSHYSGYTPS